MDLNAKRIKKSLITTIDNVVDDILLDIFVRLHTYKSVIPCKFVSKRWLTLLSSPEFIVRYLNHKKALNNDEVQEQLAWSFLSTIGMEMDMDTTIKTIQLDSDSHNTSKVPKFSLNFLPIQAFKVVATFKDLILCIDNNNTNMYYMCNPLLKQWVALPPSPRPHERKLTRTTLICEDPYHDINRGCVDYRFRVVVFYLNRPILHPSKMKDPLKRLYLWVFCSENFQWKSVDLMVSLGEQQHGMNPIFFICRNSKGMVYFRHNPYFGMFNPFEITPTSSSCVYVESLPLFDNALCAVDVFECGGQMIVIDTCYTPLLHINRGVANVFMAVLELDFNYVKRFNTIFCGTCKGSVSAQGYTNATVLGMHPRNNKMLYLRIENEVILCDLLQSSLKSLGRMAPDRIRSSHIFQLQYLPTPLPRHKMSSK